MVEPWRTGGVEGSGCGGEESKRDSYIVSDCDSVGVFYDNQHYTSTPEEAAAAALKAGLDLDCGPFLGLHTEDAVKKGLLSEVDHIDLALANTLTVQMRLGMFDGSTHPYANLGPRDVCIPAHQQLALDAATQGIVLSRTVAPPCLYPPAATAQ
ncbi:hypothetical protein ACLB2K_053701 [Fragaria x ananassa]